MVVSTKWQNISLLLRGRNKQTVGQEHSNNSKNTTQWMTSPVWRILAELNNPFISPNLADKHAIKDELKDRWRQACFGLFLN